MTSFQTALKDHEHLGKNQKYCYNLKHMLQHQEPFSLEGRVPSSEDRGGAEGNPIGILLPPYHGKENSQPSEVSFVRRLAPIQHTFSEASVRLLRLRQRRELVRMLEPVEATGVDDAATHAVALPGNEPSTGCGATLMQKNYCAMHLVRICTAAVNYARV